MVVRRCCQCNGSNAKCLHCSCVRSKTPCSSCHPSQSGRYRNISGNIPNTHNTPGNIPSTHISSTLVPSTHVPSNQTPSPTVTPSAMYPPASPDPISPSPNVLPPSSLSLPSFLLISRAHVFMLQHVPKGACDTWSGLVTTELNSILSSPSDMNSWHKFMMLAKCILVNPSGRHFSWRDTLRIIKDRAKRWFEGDLQVSGWMSLLKSPRPAIN